MSEKIPKTVVVRSALVNIMLVAPILAGWISNFLNIQPVGFVLLAIYPQTFLFFPMGYMQSTAIAVLFSMAYWVCVFLASNILVKDSLVYFLITFLFIALGSVWVVHIILDTMGYNLHIDSV